LRLRPGVTLDDCINLLTAVADGLAMRALADPGVRIVDHTRRRSLLGTAVLVLIAGCLERAGPDDGLPLEQMVGDMVGQPSAGPVRKSA
jgi:hypothetical protein